MSTATIDGISFPVNPSMVSWSYTVNMSTHKTIGGKVVQLYGWRMGDLTIGGHFGSVDRQKAFFEQLRSIADKQAPTLDRRVPQPVRFRWPERNWDFWVFLKKVNQDGASVAVDITHQSVAPRYTMSLFVAEDNGNIVKAAESAAQTAYINRLTAGLGWEKSSWNGPVDLENFAKQTLGLSPIDFFLSEYGRAQIVEQTGSVPERQA